MAEAKKRKNVLQVWLSDVENDIISMVADNEGLSKSDLIRRLIRRLDTRQLKNIDAGLIIDDYINRKDNTKPLESISVQTRDIKSPSS